MNYIVSQSQTFRVWTRDLSFQIGPAFNLISHLNPSVLFKIWIFLKYLFLNLIKREGCHGDYGSGSKPLPVSYTVNSKGNFDKFWCVEKYFLYWVYPPDNLCLFWIVQKVNCLFFSRFLTFTLAQKISCHIREHKTFQIFQYLGKIYKTKREPARTFFTSKMCQQGGGGKEIENWLRYYIFKRIPPFCACVPTSLTPCL